MKTAFSKSWNRSTQPRKQRKYRYNAPLHTLNKFIGCRLSKELKEKYGKRTLTLRKGDSIKIMSGQFKGKTGKVENVITKDSKVHIEGIQITKKDGNKLYYPIHISNLMLTEVNMDDKKRAKRVKQR